MLDDSGSPEPGPVGDLRHEMVTQKDQMRSLVTLMMPLAVKIHAVKQCAASAVSSNEDDGSVSAALSEMQQSKTEFDNAARYLGLDPVADRAMLVAAMQMSMFVVDFVGGSDDNPQDPAERWQKYLARFV